MFEHITKSVLPRMLAKLDPGLNEDQVRELVARINHKLHAGGKLLQYKGPEKFLGWLRMLAVHERADFFRELYRGGAADFVSKDDDTILTLDVDYGRAPPYARRDPSDEAQHAEIMRKISACLGRLAREDREILERRLLADEPYEDIAAAMGFAAENAHLKVHRARGRLAACLEKSGLKSKAPKKKPKDSPGKGVKE